MKKELAKDELPIAAGIAAAPGRVEALSDGVGEGVRPLGHWNHKIAWQWQVGIKAVR
jgi:hypothetical protein